jgi:hypothetical protein
MINTISLIYFKLADLISTLFPSTDGTLNQIGMNMLTDPGVIIAHIFEQILVLVAIIVIMPLYIAYRIFMGLIGQPVPVPWF